MSERLAAPAPEELTEAQRVAYDEIVHGRRTTGPQLFRIVRDGGQLLGPLGPMVLHPAVGRPLQALGAALRYDGSLSPAAREIVICTVSVTSDCEYEWNAHSAVAASVGVSDSVLKALRLNQTPAELSGEEGTAHRLTLALLSSQAISDDLFATARSDLGIEGVVEVVAIVGYYRMLANLMNVFDLDRC